MPAVLPAVFAHPSFPDYQLLDSGQGEKLERFGERVLVRPDPQAIWRRRLAADAWERADLTFVRESDRGGRWEARSRSGAARAAPIARAGALAAPAEWTMRFAGATLIVRPTPFKHVGVFPEQAANWIWMTKLAERLRGSEPRLLNLFGYTGAASVLAAQAGSRVTHVDASKTSLAWARENASRSGLEEGAVRFLLDDALGFARREARRGQRYEGILLDPPHYGRGPAGEKWQLEDHLADLFEVCAGLLAERAFLCLSAYAIGLLPLSFVNLLGELGEGDVEVGELALPEEAPSDGRPPRLLSCGLCARFARGLS